MSIQELDETLYNNNIEFKLMTERVKMDFTLMYYHSFQMTFFSSFVSFFSSNEMRILVIFYTSIRLLDAVQRETLLIVNEE